MNDITAAEKEYYEKIYEQRRKNIAYIWRVAEKEIFRRYLRYIKEKRVLEVGCGDGSGISYLVLNLQISEFDYIGIDISENAVKQAKKIFPQSNFFVADCRKIPLPSNSIDYVLCFGVLHHLENPYDGLKEIFRVLKNRGILLLREPSDEAFKRGEGESPYEAGLNMNELMENVKTNGGKILSFVRINSPITFPIRYILERLNKPILWELKTKIDICIDKLNQGKIKFVRGLDYLIVAKKVK